MTWQITHLDEHKPSRTWKNIETGEQFSFAGNSLSDALKSDKLDNNTRRIINELIAEGYK